MALPSHWLCGLRASSSLIPPPRPRDKTDQRALYQTTGGIKWGNSCEVSAQTLARGGHGGMVAVVGPLEQDPVGPGGTCRLRAAAEQHPAILLGDFNSANESHDLPEETPVLLQGNA